MAVNVRFFKLCSVEKRDILSHQKKFRQINSLVTYLVNPLLSRNFYQKCVRENSRTNFHTVHCTVNLTFIFDKNSVKATSLLKSQKITK